MPRRPLPHERPALTRRRFLAGLTAAALALQAPTGCARRAPRIGLALGGGGARALAHVPLLEVFDELGLRPVRLSGTSMGAVIAALYGAGRSGAEIRRFTELLVSRHGDWLDALLSSGVQRWWELLQLGLGGGGLLDPAPFLDLIEAQLGGRRFADLEIPLSVVATDYWKREPVVFSRGAIRPALRASIALPGLIAPAREEGRVLVDGGLVDPVPYELLFADCDLVVAVNVLEQADAGAPAKLPSMLESTLGAVPIVAAALMREKVARRPPDIYLRPAVHDIGLLDFGQAAAIFRQGEPAARELRQRLRHVL